MSSLIVCHACDLVHSIDAVANHARVRCVRCRAELYRTSGGRVDAPIALASSALVLFILGAAYPLVTLDVNDTTRAATLASAALGLYRQGFGPMAVLVFCTTVLVPLSQVLTLLYVLIPIKAGRRAPGQNALLRLLALIRPWAMAEVFMLGALVALSKLAATTEVTPRVSLVCYGLFMLAFAALIGATPTEQLWQWVERGRP